MRCTMCGKKMNRVQIDGIVCWQCPGKTCRHVVPLDPQPVTMTASERPAGQEARK